MKKKKRKKLLAILLVVAAVIFLTMLACDIYIGSTSDSVTAQGDRRRYSYEITLSPRKAIQGQPVRVIMTVRDRVTKRLISGTKFYLAMHKHHSFFAQSPTAYSEQELTTNDKGVIEYTFVPNNDSGSESELRFTAFPSIYRTENVNVDSDKDTYPQYENEDTDIQVTFKVLPPIARFFR